LTDKWSVVELGVEQANLSTSQEALMGRRLWDIEPVSSNLGCVPANVHVYFRKTLGPRAYGQSPFVVKEIEAPSPDGTEVGTVIIHDDLMAEYAATTLINGDDLDTQAALRAVEFYRVRRDWFADPVRKVYSGAISKILTGSEIECVSWMDAGHGVMTETRRTPDSDPMEKWPGNEHQPWRLVEYVRISSAAPASGDDALPAGMQAATVVVYNPSSGSWEEICDCIWKGANEEVGVEDWRYPSRYVGNRSGVPVYVSACCEGTEGGSPASGDDGGSYIDEDADTGDPGSLVPPPTCAAGDNDFTTASCVSSNEWGEHVAFIGFPYVQFDTSTIFPNDVGAGWLMGNGAKGSVQVVLSCDLNTNLYGITEFELNMYCSEPPITYILEYTITYVSYSASPFIMVVDIEYPSHMGYGVPNTCAAGGFRLTFTIP
jgi:hypothetical protein